MSGANKGLEDIVAAPSSVCSIVDGVLRYRGIEIEELANQSNFEETVLLLWNGQLPSKSELETFRAEVDSHLDLPDPVLNALKALPKQANFMDVLRTAVSVMGHFDTDMEHNTPEANRKKALRLTATLPAVVASWEAIRNQREPVHAKKGLSLAANFLYMLTGEEPTALAVETFDKALILHADHEFNASTFSARVTAATLSDLHSAIVSAIGTLKGPLHGGANTRVMQTLMNIGSVDNVETYLDEALAKKERIMGFGHRVYKTGDPRAKVLKAMSERLSQEKGDKTWFQMSTKLEDLMKEKKGLLPNVDFYSASTYHLLGIPHDMYTPIFAMSRIAGWTAHVMEQHENNRLIRPRADYVGVDEASYTPINER